MRPLGGWRLMEERAKMNQPDSCSRTVTWQETRKLILEEHGDPMQGSYFIKQTWLILLCLKVGTTGWIQAKGESMYFMFARSWLWVLVTSDFSCNFLLLCVYRVHTTYAESRCTGRGSNMSGRVKWEKQLSDIELRRLTSISFVDDGWLSQQAWWTFTNFNLQDNLL